MTLATKGVSVAEANAITAQVLNLLDCGEAPPASGELRALAVVADYPVRRACATGRVSATVIPPDPQDGC